MAHYQQSVRVSKSVDKTFAYVRDFRNSVKWDPMVTRAYLVTPEPIGLGARFDLMSKFFVPRTILLPYTVEAYEPCRRLVLSGEVSMMKYTDTILFDEVHDGTIISYDAVATLTGIVKMGNVAFTRMFRRIGDKAVFGIQKAIEENA